jgi:hypothetical protein
MLAEPSVVALLKDLAIDELEKVARGPHRHPLPVSEFGADNLLDVGAQFGQSKTVNAQIGECLRNGQERKAWYLAREKLDDLVDLRWHR